MKVAIPGGPEPTDDDFRFMRQLGVDRTYVRIMPDTPDDTVEGLQTIVARYADGGVVVDNIRNMTATSMLDDILLATPLREPKIEAFKAWLRKVQAAGLTYTIALASPGFVLSSGFAQLRGGVQAREVDLSKPLRRGLPQNPGVIVSDEHPVGERPYTHDEVFGNFVTFLREIEPVVEETGVRVGFHPDDPPIPEAGRAARIFSTEDDIRTAFHAATSDKIGLTICCGTWLEGIGDPVDAIYEYVPTGRVWEIHFRNVTATLPRFSETFPDEGYYDMFRIMEALVATTYSGNINFDHELPIVGGSRAYAAYAQGYMKALLAQALRAQS